MRHSRSAAQVSPYTPLDAPYRGGEPRFYDPRDCPEAEMVLRAWSEIRDEVGAFLAGGAGGLRPNFDPYGFDVAGWRTLNFQTYGRRYHASRRLLPQTAAILDSVPGLTSAYLNVLEPHTSIPEHYGDSDTIRRCHIGLAVPSRDPAVCGIEIAGERRGWGEGELLVFCDAHPHAAWNHSGRPRAILVFDEHVAAVPQPVQRALHRILGLAVAAWLPLQRIDWTRPFRRRRALAA